jgi:hypothetical protein
VSLLAVGFVAGVVVGPRLLVEAPESRTPRVLDRETTRIETPASPADEFEVSVSALREERDVEPPEPDPEAPVDLVEVLRVLNGMWKHSPAFASMSVDMTLRRLVAQRGLEVAPGWILSDATAAREVLEAVLTAAGIELDDGQRAALAALAGEAATLFGSAAKYEGNETERMAMRREAELRVEAGLADVLRTGQMAGLDRALGGRTVIGILPGGDERDTLSSTGVDEAKAATMALANLRKRIGLTEDAHPAVREAVADYVRRVVDLNGVLEARWGRGFVEAVCSGPTPHTEAGRVARAEPGYARRELEARAALWRLQADLERNLGPLVTEEQRAALRVVRPTALRFLTAAN